MTLQEKIDESSQIYDVYTVMKKRLEPYLNYEFVSLSYQRSGKKFVAIVTLKPPPKIGRIKISINHTF